MPLMHMQTLHSAHRMEMCGCKGEVHTWMYD